MVFDGGCACGTLRYRLNKPPIFVQACHCTDCQRITGSAFVVNAWIEASEVEMLAGETKSHQLAGGSGTPNDVHFCADCGTYLWTNYHGAAGCLFVRVGTLDDPGALPPRANIFTKSAQSWLPLSKDLPRFEGFYDPAEFLPEESLARLGALR